MEDNLLNLKDTKGRLIAEAQMAKNRMFLLHLKTECRSVSMGSSITSLGSGIYALGI